MNWAESGWDSGLEYAVLSDIGLRRANNQDAYAVDVATSPSRWEGRGHLFLVADGMGAHAAGELASKMAADYVPLAYTKQTELTPPEALRAAIEEANDKIHSRGSANADFHGMGTTASSLVLLPQGAIVAHVGDSRVYRLRDGLLEQLTFDHSLVWEMMHSGHAGAAQAPSYLPKNIITRSLGPNADVQVDVEGPFPVQVGDRYLLCSDGLTGQVEDDELGMILASMSPTEAANALVDLANLRGGPDNITLIVVEVRRLPAASGHAGWAPVRHRPPERSPEETVRRWQALFAAVGVALLLAGAAGLWWKQRLLAAAIIALAAAAGAIWLLLRWPRSESPRRPGPTTDVLLHGKGPYTSTRAAPTREFVERLSDVVRQLRVAAQEEQWTIDWDHFDQLCRQADTAVERQSYGPAVQATGQAISFMMNELRSQRTKQGD